MSEKNNVNSKPSIEDEFLKKNLPAQPTNKICPQCGKIYSDENILFCYYDGTKLTLTTQQKQSTPQQMTPFPTEFGGFELNLQNSAHNVQIPIEIFQATTRLLQTNPKMPVESDNVKTWFWSLPFPRKKRNFFSKMINNVAFSRTNIFSYLICYLLILVTYLLWISSIDSSLFADLSIAKPINFLIIGAACFIVLLILIFPILSFGYTETEVLQASRKDFFLRIEPVLLVIVLLLNIFVFKINGPLPILIIPGEPKVKLMLPPQYIVSSIKRSIYPSLFLTFAAFGGILLVRIGEFASNPFLEKSIEMMALFAITILILELIPFGSSIGKILLKNKPILFYFSFTALVAMLVMVLSILKLTNF